MGKKLFEKSLLVSSAAGVRAAPLPVVEHTQAVEHVSKTPKTGPGTMIQFMGQQSSAIKEVEALREQAKAFEGSKPARKIDPKLIRSSKWANRHEASFATAEFAAFVDEITSAGGNVQPIKVRRLPAGGEFEFETVFGHRRHRACLERGLMVLAVIDELTDQALFVEMDRENRQRADLRPFEQGQMYAKALDEGLFSSARKLADGVGADLGSVGKAVALARLPVEVIKAFESPLDLQFRWATDLTQALQKDPDLVLAAAKRIQAESPRLPAKQVLQQLTKGGRTVLPPSVKPISIKGKSGQSGVVSFDVAARSAVVTFKNIDPERVKELRELVEKFLG